MPKRSPKDREQWRGPDVSRRSPRFVDHFRDGWHIRYFIEERQGRPIVRELRVQSIDDDAPEGGLTSRFMHKVRPSEAVMRYLRGARIATETGLGRLFNDVKRDLIANPRRPGRHGHPDVYYADLAREYVALVNKPSRQPVKDLATSYGVQPERMRDWIAEARRRGLLTSPPKGQAGGALTPVALELLSKKGD